MLAKLDNFYKTPMTPYDVLFNMISRAEEFFILKTALEFNLFDHLKELKDVNELSRELGLNLKVAEKLCNTLTSMGLLEKRNTKYRCSEMALEYLTSSSPFYQGHLIRIYLNTISRFDYLLPKALKEGPLRSRGEASEEYIVNFTLAMAEASLRGPLQRVLKVLSSLEKFWEAEKLLDLGGGHGLYAIAFAKMNPKLKTYVLDFPQVIDLVTKKLISIYGVEGRVCPISADFEKDDIGGDYDIIFASHCLYTKDLHLVLGKVYRSLKPGGLLISNHWFADPEKTNPATAIRWELSLTLYGYDVNLFTLEEFIDILKSSNFSVRDIVDISSPEDPSKIVIAERM